MNYYHYYQGGTEKYRIIVKSSDTDLLNTICRQMTDTFINNNRSDVIKVDTFDLSSDEITLSIIDKTKFIPTVTYVRDSRIEDEVKPSSVIETSVRILGGTGVTPSEIFSEIAEPIHYNFKGLKEYIDSDIVINVNCDKGIFIGFCGNCKYYPVIGAVYRG